MKIIVGGYGGHGKGTFCKLLGLPSVSSSLVALNAFIWQEWGRHHYATKHECYMDRRMHRATWFNLIQQYNAKDGARLARKLFEGYDVYDGIRCKDEFSAIRAARLYDLSIWVDASKRCLDELSDSCTVTPDMFDVILKNNGTEDDFKRRVISFKEGLLQWTQ